MGFFTEEIAIDLGTANTLIIHNDKVVINSPSIVAMDRSTKKIIAQKGSGGARHASKKAPIFVGGGVAHGPKGSVYKIKKIN